METASTPNPQETDREFQPWGNVSDPRKHNPNKFRYLLHGINPLARSSMGLVAALMQPGQNAEVSKVGDQTIDLSEKPERLAERVALSCSLIDQDHYGTWGKAGLIVEAPVGNVCITQTSDAGAFVMDKNRLLEQSGRQPLLTADQLLPQTPSGSYNEVVVLADNNSQKVRLAGFFIKNIDGTPLDEDLAEKFRMHATRLNLPIIEIPEPNPYQENRIVRFKSELSVLFNGKEYSLVGPEERRFKSNLPRGFSLFSSPAEIKQVLQFLREQGISEAEVKQLEQDYIEVDKRRQQPKVYFDDNGDVLRIEKSEGYGEEEIKINISRLGATKSAALELAKAINRKLNNASGIQRREDHALAYTLALSEVDAIIQEVLQTASGAERQKIEAWYQGIRDSLIKHSG